MNSLHIAGQTDVGRHRQENQDTFIQQTLWSNHNALLAVIDGVGGYAGGAQAAAVAKEAIVQYMAAPTGDTLTMLREAVVYANNQIVQQRQQDPALARMCCVLTAVVADTQTRRLHYVHVGDTRLYRFRNGQLAKLTHDHSLVGVREDANYLTEHEAMRHPRRNEILRDIGSVTHRVDDPDFLESGDTDFLPGDVIVLCSDGLTDMLTRAQVTDVLKQAMPLTDQVTELIRLANEQGGQDNITVVLAQYPALTTETDVAPLSVPAVEPMSGPTPGTAVRYKPTEGRNRVRGILLALLIILLVAVLWWRFASPGPGPRPVTQPLPADSSAHRLPANPSDSIRTP